MIVNTNKIPKGGRETRLTKTLGKNIGIYRRKKGLTQSALASLIDVSPNYISAVENGRKYPSLRVISRIAEALNVKPSELLSNDSVFADLKELAEIYDIKNIVDGLKEMYPEEFAENENDVHYTNS